MKKLQELYEQRQKAKEEEYAASQKLKDQQYLDTIQQLRASVAELKESVAELKEMVQKMEKPPAAVPPKLEEAPMPRLSPGMKKPSEIVPKGS
jgi:predicted RNase H-like nuclease (RuvC/YqgF family)